MADAAHSWQKTKIATFDHYMNKNKSKSFKSNLCGIVVFWEYKLLWIMNYKVNYALEFKQTKRALCIMSPNLARDFSSFYNESSQLKRR